MARNRVVSYKMVQTGTGSRLYPPPPLRFNGVVKAVRNKGRNYTKIGNLVTI